MRDAKDQKFEAGVEGELILEPGKTLEGYAVELDFEGVGKAEALERITRYKLAEQPSVIPQQFVRVSSPPDFTPKSRQNRQMGGVVITTTSNEKDYYIEPKQFNRVRAIRLPGYYKK